MFMHQYKFTIVTVCYNAEKFIRQTIQSVKEQKFEDYEYIIIDGCSTDQTMEIVHSELDGKKDVQIVSEKDCGIYDAMNKAVDIACGEYVLFLNAGDELSDDLVLDKANQFMHLHRNALVVFGNTIQVQKNGIQNIRKYSVTCAKKSYFLSGDCICHQAIFAKAKLLKSRKFDLNYRVCADKEWQLYCLSNKIKFQYVDTIISKVLVEGFSSQNVEKFEKETLECLKVHYRYMVWVYQIIDKMKKNIILCSLMRRIGKLIFMRN